MRSILFRLNQDLAPPTSKESLVLTQTCSLPMTPAFGFGNKFKTQTCVLFTE
jgi:hypothetical protein